MPRHLRRRSTVWVDRLAIAFLTFFLGGTRALAQQPCTCPAEYQLQTIEVWNDYFLENGEAGDVIMHKGGNPFLFRLSVVNIRMRK